MNSQILSATVKIVFVIQLVLSVFLLLQGHNLPGGGFIGGLVAAAAFTVYHIGLTKKVNFFGTEIRPSNLLFIGLSCSLAAGLWGLIVHGSFLQAVWGPNLPLPIVGYANLGSVLLFDIGVYLLVAGMTTELVYVLGEEVMWNS